MNGYLNDKFAINEQGEEYLYVLPTSNTGSQPVNSLHVLDKDMNEVGVINEIARGGEYIRSPLCWKIRIFHHIQADGSSFCSRHI